MMHAKKEAPSNKKKYTFQQHWCTYLIINCAFLLPALLITGFPQVRFLMSHMPDFFGALFLIYWIPVILYYLFRLMYLHFILSLVFWGFSVHKLIKEKNSRQFLLISVLTVLSFALNLYWLMHGRPYTIV